MEPDLRSNYGLCQERLDMTFDVMYPEAQPGFIRGRLIKGEATVLCQKCGKIMTNWHNYVGSGVAIPVCSTECEEASEK